MVYYFAIPKRNHLNAHPVVRRPSGDLALSAAAECCGDRRGASDDTRKSALAPALLDSCTREAVPPGCRVRPRHRTDPVTSSCHRSHRQGRCLDRLVPEPGRRLLDVGGLSRRAGGAGDLRQRSARRAGLGSGPARQGRRMRGRLSRHRRVGLCFGRPACDLARRPLPDLAGRRLAAAQCQRTAGRAHHAGAVERGRVDRHLERRWPARQPRGPVRADRSLRARRSFDDARDWQRNAARFRPALPHVGDDLLRARLPPAWRWASRGPAWTASSTWPEQDPAAR